MRRLTMLTLVLALTALVSAVPGGSWCWPAEGPVVRGFFNGDDPYAGGQHRGIDVGGAVGAPVLAPVGGAISFVGSVPGSGRAVTIRTDDGYAVTLVGVGSYSVARGESVSEGQQIATISETGDSGSHVASVHLGVRIASDPNGYIDPLTLLPARSLPASPGSEVDERPSEGDVVESPEEAPGGENGGDVDSEEVESPAAAAPEGGETTDAPSTSTPEDEQSSPADDGASNATNSDEESPTGADAQPPSNAASDSDGDASSAPGNTPVAIPVAPEVPSISQSEPSVGEPTAGSDPTATETVPSGGTGDTTSLPPVSSGARRSSRGFPSRANAVVRSDSAMPAFSLGANDVTSVSENSSTEALAQARASMAQRGEIGINGRLDSAGFTGTRARNGEHQPPAGESREEQTSVGNHPSSERGFSARWLIVLVSFVSLALLLAAAVVAAALFRSRRARIMLTPRTDEPDDARRNDPEEDTRGSRVALCERAAPYRPCRGLRRSLGHLRPLSPTQGQRRAHGERHRRARYARDGRR